MKSRPLPLYWVEDEGLHHDFPDPVKAGPEGLVALGGDLSPERLLDAYRRGIFPWYSVGDPILWWSPDPRCALLPGDLKISKSLAKTLKKQFFSVTFNRAFAAVVQACAAPRARAGDSSPRSQTWITPEMAAAYIRMRELGYGVSVECWRDGRLAGGLYGLAIGRVFFGESMFSRVRDASKVALAHLTRKLEAHRYRLIDCQVHSAHLRSLGAKALPRETFVALLRRHCGPQVQADWPKTAPAS